MKTIITIVSFLLVLSLAKAQDTTLPQGKCQIYLNTGKTLKNVRLWKIDESKVEYLKEENLHDVGLREIQYIKTGNTDFVFNDSGKLSKVKYDVVILQNLDSIFCFITEISQQTIKYTYLGKQDQHWIYRTEVKKYLLKGEEESARISATSSSAQNVSVTSQSTKETVTTDHREINYYELGKEDAHRYFKPKGFIGEIFCGFIPVAGWITGIIIMAVPPNLDNPSNPNNKLINSNQDYRNGYKKVAHQKKLRNTAAGFLVGGTLFLAATL